MRIRVCIVAIALVIPIFSSTSQSAESTGHDPVKEPYKFQTKDGFPTGSCSISSGLFDRLDKIIADKKAGRMVKNPCQHVEEYAPQANSVNTETAHGSVLNKSNQ